MAERISPLAYPVRLPVVTKYVGQLCLALAAFTMVPVLASLVFGEYRYTLMYLGLVLLLTASGLPAARLDAPASLQNNEGLVISGVIFIISPLVFSLPIMADGASWSSALFEATSAVTTTGLSLYPDVEAVSHTLLFVRAWNQWVGGLGIVVLSVGLLMGPGAVAMRLAHIEGTSEDIAGSTRSHAGHALIVYVALTVAGIALLLAFGANAFDAVLHVLAAVSTGGFSTFNESLSGFANWALVGATVCLGFLGALPLLIFHRAAIQGWRCLLGSLQVRAVFMACLAISAYLTLMLVWERQIPVGHALPHGFAIGFSAQTTTGFTTMDIAELGPAAKIGLIISMFIGAGVGSTGGGIKVIRLLILLRLVQLTVQRSALPKNAVAEARLGAERLDNEDLTRAMTVIFLFALVVLVSWLAFILAGYPAIDALFEVTSAAGTVGLSTGIASSELEPHLKYILCLDMVAGRLEVFALLVILYPRTWLGKRTG